MAEPEMSETLRRAIAFHQQGRLDEARRLYEEAISTDPANAHACYLLANIHAQQGQWKDAEKQIRQAISRQEDAVYHDTLGRILTAQRRLDEAESAFRRAVQLRPDFAVAHNNLGRLLESRGRANQALHQFQRAIELQPEFAEPWVGLGDLRRAQGRLQESLEAYDRALAIQDSAWVQLRRGAALQAQDRLEEAEASFRRATEMAPSFAEAHAYLGTVRQRLGRLDEAVSAYEDCLRLAPLNGAALAGLLWIMDLRGERQAALKRTRPLLERGELPADAAVSLARIHQHEGDIDAGVRLLQDLLSGDLNRALEVRARFALGALLDARGDYDAAFTAFARANALKNVRFDAELHRSQFRSLAQTFSRANLARLPRSGNDAEPVFIVGMPRSGTSLVEEILASHPLVRGGGELELLGDLARGLPQRLGSQQPYPACVLDVTRAHLAEMAREYLDGLGGKETPVRLVTDKMPTNFLHLGLIQLLFPDARVIHCRRDPLDTGLSCYFHDFLGGGLAFSFDLGNIGCYYRLYEGLMAHWRQVLDLSVLEVDYEDIVHDQEGVTRRLLEFCGLPWDERCLRFYESDRTVITASSAQVRRPVYTTSVGRWKYYEEHIGPLKTALAENTADSGTPAVSGKPH